MKTSLMVITVLFVAFGCNPKVKGSPESDAAAAFAFAFANAHDAVKATHPDCGCAVCTCSVCIGQCGYKVAKLSQTESYYAALDKALAGNRKLVVFCGTDPCVCKDCDCIRCDGLKGVQEPCVLVSEPRNEDGKTWMQWTSTLTDCRADAVKAVVNPVASFRQPQGHTHTCSRCGTTWDHATNPSHDCPNCGETQYVQDSSPSMVTTKTGNAQAVAAGGCANGQCGTPTRTVRTVNAFNGFSFGTGGCANGQCGR